MEDKPHLPMPAPQPPKPQQSDLNVMGLIGLILGIFGFFTVFTGPIGLVLSYMGLKHPNNGLAIGGLVVSILSTIYFLFWVGFFVLYFGAIGAICLCFGLSARGDIALQNAVEKEVAAALGRQSYEVDLEGFTTNPSTGDSRSFSGTAVYEDKNAKSMAVDVSGDAKKVNGKWRISNLVIGDPYERGASDADDGDGAQDGSTDPADAGAFDAGGDFQPPNVEFPPLDGGEAAADAGADSSAD